ncbi:MAG: DnaD domain protein, partial [Oscillospiraceae bacterium]|nr:DnaD domain protein [Oscillospiraceae bacterium]
LIDAIFDKYNYDESFISEVMTRNPEANLPYISAVLKDWNKKGYRTISDVRLNSLSSSAAAVTPADTENSDSLFRKAIRKINEAK